MRTVAPSSASAPLRVLILEPYAFGHHATWLRWVVEAVTERGWTAVVATTETTLENPLLAGLERASNVELRVIDYPAPDRSPVTRLGILRAELASWRAMRRAVRAELAAGGAAAVVLPYLDYCFFAFGAFGVPERRVPWHVISMRLSLLDGATIGGVRWKWWLARRLLAAPSLRTLLAICPSVRRAPRFLPSTSSAAKLRYLPDPAEQRVPFARDAARAQLGLAPGQIAVLIFGAIDERKGLLRLGDALAADPGLGAFALVVAGKQTATLRRALEAEPFETLRRGGRVIELDRVLDDAEQGLAFAAADVVWLGYERHLYMSGVLALAGRAGLPVAATAEGEIGALVAEHDLGVLIEPKGIETVSAGLRRLLDDSARRRWGRRAAAAFEAHTPANFKQILVAALERDEVGGLPVNRLRGAGDRR